MDIAGRYHRLMKFLAQRHDLFIDLHNVFHAVDIPHPLGSNHKFVVSKRLDFQIIIKIYQSCNLFLRLSVQKRPVKLSCFAGASKQKPLPVLHQKAFGNSGPFTVIGQMGSGNKRI